MSANMRSNTRIDAFFEVVYSLYLLGALGLFLFNLVGVLALIGLLVGISLGVVGTVAIIYLGMCLVAAAAIFYQPAIPKSLDNSRLVGLLGVAAVIMATSSVWAATYIILFHKEDR